MICPEFRKALIMSGRLPSNHSTDIECKKEQCGYWTKTHRIQYEDIPNEEMTQGPGPNIIGGLSSKEVKVPLEGCAIMVGAIAQHEDLEFI